MIGFKTFENFKERQQSVIFHTFLGIIMQVKICLIEKATQIISHTHAHTYFFHLLKIHLLVNFIVAIKGKITLNLKFRSMILV